MKAKQLINKIKNLFGSDTYYQDKVVTVEKYLSMMSGELPVVEDFEELYQIAEKYIGKQSFNEVTSGQPDYFHELSRNEGIIAVFVGCFAYAIAKEVDNHGSDFEKAIDDILPKNYDINNPFDLKKGYGHRIFGHDPIAFGIKNIPADLVIKAKKEGENKAVAMTVADLLGCEKNDIISMWDIIWKFYGSENKYKGIMNCLGHTIVHFAKDIVTTAGLPLPLISLFNNYSKLGNETAHYLNYKDSLMQKLDNMKLNMKASDFASYIFLESIIDLYCKTTKVDTDSIGFKNDMKLLSMGTYLSIQMASVLLGDEIQLKKGSKKVIPGAKINLLMSGSFLKIVVKEMTSVISARSALNRYYEQN